jgi:phage shock protein E
LAKRLVKEGAVLLDVRQQDEWDEGHLEGAKLLPVAELESRLAEVERLTGGDKTKPIVVYCQAGGRAGRAKSMLAEAGYTHVTNMGGMKDWPGD